MSFFYPDTIDFQCLAIFFYYGCRFETLIENHALSRLLFWIDHKPLSSFVFCGVHVIFTLYTTFKLFCSHGQIKRKMFLKILKGNLIAYLLQAWIAHIEWKKLMVWFYQKSYGFFLCTFNWTFWNFWSPTNSRILPYGQLLPFVANLHHLVWPTFFNFTEMDSSNS